MGDDGDGHGAVDVSAGDEHDREMPMGAWYWPTNPGAPGRLMKMARMARMDCMTKGVYQG